MIFGFLKELSVGTFSARKALFPSSNFLFGFIRVPSVLIGQNKKTANRKRIITIGRMIFFALDNAMVCFFVFFWNDVLVVIFVKVLNFDKDVRSIDLCAFLSSRGTRDHTRNSTL